jgi:cell division protein ZipA
MDFGVRELLFVVGLLFIAGILFDGLRRMRKSRGELYGLPPDYDQIQVNRADHEPDFDRINPTADVIDLRTDSQRNVGAPGQVIPHSAESVRTGSGQQPVSAQVGHGRQRRAFEKGRGADEMVQQERTLERAPINEPVNHELPNGGARRVGELSSFEQSPKHLHSDTQATAAPLPNQESYAHQERDDALEPLTATGGDRSSEYKAHPSAEANVELGSARRSAQSQGIEPNVNLDTEEVSTGSGANEEEVPADQNEVLVFNIIAKDKGTFSGPSLIKAVEMCQMQLGDMDIFHRYDAASGETQFSMANLLKPGTFDLDTMHDFRSPGVCLFMQLPGPKRSIVALERMVETARKLAIKLGAEMRDENHSVITPQTIEHYRQRVMEFERKRRTRRYAEVAYQD